MLTLTKLLALGPLLLISCSNENLTPPRPAPQDEGEDGRREQRERWIEQIHRAAPGTDWRATEEANQRRQLAKRNAMRAQLGQPGAGTATGNAWEEVGSRNQAGHTRCAALGPARQGQRWLYVGSANGGLWRSPEDGSAWTPMSDALFGGVDEVVALEPANLNDADIIIQRRGALVHRSEDGGLTWNAPSGLGQVATIRRMITLRDASQSVLLYTQASVGSGGSNRSALFASIDGGKSFGLRWASPTNWPGDVWSPRYGPGSGSEVYVLQGGKLRKSMDAGFNFSLVGEVDLSASEGSLQGSEAGAPTFYVAARSSGDWKIHRSTDAGATWSDQGPPPAYWGSVTSLAAFSSDPDALFVGGLEGWRSADGGLTWTRVNTWGSYYQAPGSRLHADLRGLSPLPDPDLPGIVDRLYVNTDGGTYVSMDLGHSVQNLSLSGLGVGQFYSTHTSSEEPTRILGGTQDQGYQRGHRQPWTSGPSTDFEQLISGDYGHLCSGDGDHDFVFSTYPGFILVQVGELTPALQQVDFPGASDSLWLPPVVADPRNQEDFYFLGDFLWRYSRSGSGWSEVLHSTRNFANGAGSYLSAMAFSAADPDRAYASDDAGRLWWSVDGGVTWTKSSDTGPGNHYFYGNGIATHPIDPLRAVVCGSGYSAAGVRETIDGGLSWQAHAPGLPNTLAYDIAWAGDGSDDLYTATEAGAWRYDAQAGVWTDIMGTEAPATTYWSVESVPAEGRIRFGTYGRGIWDYLLGAPSSTILFADDFESGDFSTGGWSITSQARCRIKPKAARTGSLGARLKKGGKSGKITSMTRSVDTTGWNRIWVGLSHRSKDYEAHEYLTGEWFDGSIWHAFNVSQDGAWLDPTFLLPGQAGNNPAFQLRITASSKGKSEWSDLDDVIVRAGL